jgi:predicted adenine nucleotide alpha hydrolase (AANH) superfamily ATPase
MERLLLHICCAPDATVAIERLTGRFALTGFFYNPNIEPFGEYTLREAEARMLSARLWIDYHEETPLRNEWAGLCLPYSEEPERGERCRKCISHRLEVAALRAAELNFSAFTTTLTTSPHKDVEFIHDTGNSLGRQHGVLYLPETFRARDGFRRSLALSREYDLYRQNYCGCRWSLLSAQRALQSPGVS